MQEDDIEVKHIDTYKARDEQIGFGVEVHVAENGSKTATCPDFRPDIRHGTVDRRPETEVWAERLAESGQRRSRTGNSAEFSERHFGSKL